MTAKNLDVAGIMLRGLDRCKAFLECEPAYCVDESVIIPCSCFDGRPLWR